MAEFNKNKVCHKGKIFPICVGDIGYYSNSLEEMQEFVEKETGIQGVLTDILVGDYPFEINHSDGAGFKFFYLISYKEDEMTVYVNKDKLPENCLKYVESFIKSIKGKKDIKLSYDMKQLIITLSNSETNDFWKILLEGYFEELGKNNICLENLFYELSEISNKTNFKKLAEDNIIFKEFILMFYEILLNEEYTNIIKDAFNLFKLLFDNNVRFFFENGKLKIIGMNSYKLIIED